MPSKIIKPFTYIIGWTSLDKFYFGVRYKKGCSPDDLWDTYFTSSKHVKRFREVHGEPDIIKICKIFDCKTQARMAEHEYLKRVNASTNKRYLNKSNSDGKFINYEWTDERKRKHSELMTGRKYAPRSKECRESISKANKGRKRIFTEEHLAALKGIPKTEDHKKKISEAQKGLMSAYDIVENKVVKIMKDIYHMNKDRYLNLYKAKLLGLY
jgi:hypothetical protein